MSDFENHRRDMVQRQIAGRGVRDRRVLDALLAVPREVFVPERLHKLAYEDTALPIEEEQTISQPYIVALMAEARRRALDRFGVVLEREVELLGDLELPPAGETL